MFQITSSSKDAFSNWADFIRYKADFYIAQPLRERTDDGFPWQQIDKPLPKLPAKASPGFWQRLRGQSPAPSKEETELQEITAHLAKVQNRHTKNFERSAEQLFEARSLLEDDLSRHLFDETIVLRLAGHRNFIGPRIHFDRVMEKIDETPFKRDGFPDSYLGVPLVEVTVEMKTPDRTIRTTVIVPQGFDQSFNTYRQYLINRGTVDFLPNEGDVIFDCGACIGDMSATFAAFAGTTGRVHAFDPIPLHMRFCELQARRNAETSAPITMVNYAVGDEHRELEDGEVEEVDAISPAGLRISAFNITRLDDYVAKNGIDRVDLVKMDIEGAEPDALKGAESLLRELKPKLAISTYHRPDQFWSIPLQIKAINPAYRFVFGHHSPVRWESVIYAY